MAWQARPLASWKTLVVLVRFLHPIPCHDLNPHMVITMGIWSKITDFLFGCKLATTEQVKVAVDIALDNIDIDKDGYVSVGEFIKYVKAVLNYGTKRI